MDDLSRLLVAARDGDRVALAQAIRLGQADVRRFVSYLVPPPEVDDVTQDVLVRAYRALPGYRGDSTGRTWLLAIARRAAADAHRAHRRRTLLARRLESTTRHGPRTAPASAAAHSLHDLVERLDESRRSAFVLTQVVGCSYEEAATVCGVAVGTIRSRVARAREHLVREVRTAELA